MVITCPSCSARYRLNPDKIKGRGAKITCPKCEHVFVVFSGSDAAAPPPPASTPAAAPPADSAPSNRKLATTSGAFQAVGLDEADVSASTTGNIRVVAPGPRKTRRVRAMSRENIPVTQQIGGADPAPEPEDGPSQEVSVPEMAEPRSAADLDFRSVGISTWKVKVSIGLIYDFSDISTLKKYLADKKVTEDDLISHNAKDWTRIGDIGDLDQHFIETWKIAKAAGASAKPKKKKEAAAPTATGSHNAVATGSYSTSTGNFSSQQSTRTGSQRTVSGPKGGGKSRRDKAPPPEEKNNNKLFAAAAAILLLVGGGWFFFMGSGDSTQQVVAPPPSPEAQAEREANETERIQQAIRDKLERERREMQEREEAEREAQVVEEDELPIEERNLVAVPPSEQTTAAPQPDRRKLQKMQRRPTPRPTTQTTAQTATKSANYLTYLKVARLKLNGGNAQKALEAFDKAIGANPNCRECYEGRAEAKKKLGDSAGAAQDLAKAAQVGGGSARAGQ